MLKKYSVLIGLIISCIGTIHAMEQTSQKIIGRGWPSYQRRYQQSRPTPTYRYPSHWQQLKTWWQQPTQYELELQAKEKQLRDNLQRIQSEFAEERKRHDELFKHYESRYPSYYSYPSRGRRRGHFTIDPRVHERTQPIGKGLTALYLQEKKAKRQLKDFLQEQRQQKMHGPYLYD